MAKNTTPLEIFTESLRLYFSNFDKFVKYMTFPVLGQLLGLGIVFLLTLMMSKILPNAIQSFPLLSNYGTFLIVCILIIMPGMIIFTKAFWEYLVAYGAINSMLENMLKSGKVYDFDAHTELIKRRTIPYVGLWFLFGIFSLISINPLFWVVSVVFAIYFVLVFQIFTFEPELSPIGCVKRSLELVKGHFGSTLMLFALIGALTYVLVPEIINKICSYTYITKFLSDLMLPIINQLPISEWSMFLVDYHLPALNSEKISAFFVSTLIAQIFIQYTLPLRSILWSMWYKKLNNNKIGVANISSTKKKKNKKPSEILIESSNKKYSSKKLDRNILRRAMEKED